MILWSFLKTLRATMVASMGLISALPFGNELRAQSSPAKPGGGTLVYVFRGGGGYFPNLSNISNQHFKSRGLEVVDLRAEQAKKGTQEIIDAYRSKKLPKGVFIVGYSAGGPAAITVANELREVNIPVRLMVLIETIRPDLLIPSNVAGCFNLYQAPHLIIGPVKAASANTKVVNCKAHKDAGFGSEYGHFRIPWVDGVHEMIADEIVNATKKLPPGKTLRQRREKQVAQESSQKVGENRTLAAPTSGRGRELPANATSTTTTSATTTSATKPSQKGAFGLFFQPKPSESNVKTGDSMKKTEPGKTKERPKP